MPLLELYGKNPDGAIDKRVIAGMTGWIIFFPTDAPPDGTLVCNGAELSIAAYPELYDAIGTKYGGNGTTKFRLPDMEDRFPRFAGGGLAVGEKQEDAIRNIWGTTGIEGYSLQAMWCATGDFRGAFTELSTSPAYATQLSTSLVRNRNGISLDASRVVPTADENRPKAIALLACIVYI